MRIDSHHHFWTVGKYKYVWMNPDMGDMGVLCKDYKPDDLQPCLDRHHIDSSILVQTLSSLNETRWFLELAGQYSFIGGVIGWVDLKAANVGETLDEFRLNPKLAGIRHQVHDEPDDDWLLRKDVKNGLAELEKRAIPFDLLIRPQHLDVSQRIARLFAGLPLIVDHIAKPNIARKQWNDWSRGMKKLAGCRNVFCKLSGMITEADPRNWTPQDLKPYVEYLLEIFGPRRCMFGSDWPVCLLAGSYDRVVEALQSCLGQLSDSEKNDVFGGTAERVYKISPHIQG